VFSIFLIFSQPSAFSWIARIYRAKFQYRRLGALSFSTVYIWEKNLDFMVAGRIGRMKMSMGSSREDTSNDFFAIL